MSNHPDDIELKIGRLTFVKRMYGGDLDVEWVNQATDYWHSNSEECDTISREDAQKLFEMLWDYLAP